VAIRHRDRIHCRPSKKSRLSEKSPPTFQSFLPEDLRLVFPTLRYISVERLSFVLIGTFMRTCPVGDFSTDVGGCSVVKRGYQCCDCQAVLLAV